MLKLRSVVTALVLAALLAPAAHAQTLTYKYMKYIPGLPAEVPSALASPRSVDFGEVQIPGVSTWRIVTFTNTGKSVLSLGDVTAAAGFELQNGCGATLVARASCAVQVRFVPSTTGPASGQLSIPSNAHDSPSLVALSGTASRPVASLSPNPVNLGEVAVGVTSAPAELSISNTGTGVLRLSDMTFGGSELGFTVTEGSCSPLPKQLGSQESCALAVSVTPTAGGSLAGVVNVTTNDAAGTHSVPLQATGIASCTAGKQVYSYTGDDQVIQVPAGCSTATVKAWGAGGKSGGSTSTSTYPAPAGGGGFAQRTVTGLVPGASLVVVVGQGATSVSATYGGGGGAGVPTDSYWPGAGGGLSGVFANSKSQANALVIAGGGGGTSISSYAGGATGGSGGGTAGAAGGDLVMDAQTTLAGGGGGTQAYGGAGGGHALWLEGQAGAALQGGAGAPHAAGSGGGGGYWGGGGSFASGAGGGSGYAPGGTLTAGSGCNVANSADSDYVAGIGYGGCTMDAPGQNGRVVIIWQ
jgi:hypothetical protein